MLVKGTFTGNVLGASAVLVVLVRVVVVVVVVVALLGGVGVVLGVSVLLASAVTGVVRARGSAVAVLLGLLGLLGVLGPLGSVEVLLGLLKANHRHVSKALPVTASLAVLNGELDLGRSKHAGPHVSIVGNRALLDNVDSVGRLRLVGSSLNGHRTNATTGGSDLD